MHSLQSRPTRALLLCITCIRVRTTSKRSPKRARVLKLQSSYSEILRSLLRQGADYFQKEYERLDRIIAAGAASPSKLAEAARKQSVLSAFIPAMNADEKASDEAAQKVRRCSSSCSFGWIHRHVTESL